jgi:hypothetical protein
MGILFCWTSNDRDQHFITGPPEFGPHFSSQPMMQDTSSHNKIVLHDGQCKTLVQLLIKHHRQHFLKKYTYQWINMIKAKRNGAWNKALK